jgi:hypothetical protein
VAHLLQLRYVRSEGEGERETGGGHGRIRRIRGSGGSGDRGNGAGNGTRVAHVERLDAPDAGATRERVEDPFVRIRRKNEQRAVARERERT